MREALERAEAVREKVRDEVAENWAALTEHERATAEQADFEARQEGTWAANMALRSAMHTELARLKLGQEEH